MNDYILLNNSPYEFVERECTKIKIGGAVERTLNARATKDNVASKKQWKFSFFVNSTGLLRLERVFDLNTTINFKDADELLYTVICSNDEFIFKEQAEGYYAIEMSFVEV